MKKNILVLLVVFALTIFAFGCAATCVTCSTCPNTQGMSGYN